MKKFLRKAIASFVALTLIISFSTAVMGETEDGILDDAVCFEKNSETKESADSVISSAEEETAAFTEDIEDFLPCADTTDSVENEEVSEAVPSLEEQNEGEEQGSDSQNADIQEPQQEPQEEPQEEPQQEKTAPRMIAAESLNYQTVKITWSEVPEAKSYILYTKKEGSWKKVASGLKKTSYKHVSSASFPLKMGKKYTYTVKAVFEEGSSAYAENPVSVIPVPGRTTLKTAQALDYQSLQISWKKVGGAQWYGIYIMNPDGTRERIGNSKTTTYIHSAKNNKYPLKTGVKYTYSVRAFCQNGSREVYGELAENTVSGKTKPDKAVLKDAFCYEKGKIRITWNQAKGADGYLILRRTKNSSWKQIAVVKGGSKQSYTHVSSEEFPIKKGATYWYTVKSFAAENTTGPCNRTGKKVVAIPERYKWKKTGGNYYCCDLASGKNLTGMKKVKDKYYYFNSQGAQRVGWYRINGAYYYFRIADGEKGYRVSSKTINGIPIGSNGKAVESRKVRLLTRANAIANSVSDRSMSDEERLYACFVYAVRDFTYRDIGGFYAGSDWDEYYATYFLEYGYGDCFTSGAGFAYLAAALGYSDACAVSSGGHGWAEVDGLVSDPDWAWAMNDIDGYFNIPYSLSGVGGRPSYAGNRAYVKRVS